MQWEAEEEAVELERLWWMLVSVVIVNGVVGGGRKARCNRSSKSASLRGETKLS